MVQIFQLSSILVTPFWALMIFLPHWRWSQRVVASPLIALPASLLYVALFLPAAMDAVPLLLNPTLGEISRLLGTPEGATIAWVHFLAFDLFVGRWVYLNARERDLSAWLVSPILFLVLMAGPLGLSIFLGVRALVGRPARAEST